MVIIWWLPPHPHTCPGDIFTDLIFHRRKPPGYQRKTLQPQGTAAILRFSFGETLGFWDQGFSDKTTATLCHRDRLARLGALCHCQNCRQTGWLWYHPRRPALWGHKCLARDCSAPGRDTCASCHHAHRRQAQHSTTLAPSFGDRGHSRGRAAGCTCGRALAEGGRRRRGRGSSMRALRHPFAPRPRPSAVRSLDAHRVSSPRLQSRHLPGSAGRNQC